MRVPRIAPADWVRLGAGGAAVFGLIYVMTSTSDVAVPGSPDCANTELTFTPTGALDNPHSAADIQAALPPAAGVQFERFDYAPEAENVKGHLQRRHVDIYRPQSLAVTPTGVVFRIHGGGGDVGFAGGERDEIKYWIKRGFAYVDVEYRRGWSNLGFCDAANRDVFNATSAEFARQEPAARLSFADGVLAIDYATHYLDSLYGSLPKLIYGTSFGGAMTAYMVAVDSALRPLRGPLVPWLQANHIIGGLVRYGGVAQSDDVVGAVPMMLTGGAKDYLVPFSGGNSYHHLSGEPIHGVGALYQLLAPQTPTQLIATCNMGHADGAIFFNELFDLWLDHTVAAWNGSGSSSSVFYEYFGGTSRDTVPPCYPTWDDVRQEMIDAGVIQLTEE